MDSRKLFGTVIYAILVLATSSATVLGQDDPAAYRLITADGEHSPPSFSETAVDQPQGAGCCNADCCQSSCCPRWTATADFIIFDRIGGVNQTLVQRVPRDTYPSNGTELLNANDFHQGFYGGPRVGLIRHGDCCYDLELLYFQIDGWSSTKRFLPDDELLVFSAPGGFRFSSYGVAMGFEYASKLYNAEFNVRWNPCCRVTMLAGFRWIELRENLDGAWIPSTLETFWNTNTKNNLYGFQIGADGKILERGCFSIDGLVKAGIFGNQAEQTTAVGLNENQGVYSSSTNHTAFLGELGLQCKYQVTQSLTLRAGYEAMWLQGVALAPGQIQESNVDQFGVNSNSGVFYHGATAGFEYSF
ncbi:MAG: BBP7 family outer membrane beta-barrel protein [Thermoguttaceae bacterium]